MQANTNTSEDELWHKRLGHCGYRREAQTYQIVNGLDPSIKPFQGVCDICKRIKATRSIGRARSREAGKPLERIHTDYWGPAPVASLGGNRYMLTITDQYTKKLWTFFLPNRSGSLFVETFDKWRREVERESGYKVQYIRCDNAGEYVGNPAKDYFRKHGKHHAKAGTRLTSCSTITGTCTQTNSS
jgi:hypothetical protein